MQWAGATTFGLHGSKIHDCEFIDAGGRWEKGQPGVKGGITGGAIFSVWMADTEIFNNRFTRTQAGKADEVYGIKGRQGKRCRPELDEDHEPSQTGVQSRRARDMRRQE